MYLRKYPGKLCANTKIKFVPSLTEVRTLPFPKYLWKASQCIIQQAAGNHNFFQDKQHCACDGLECPCKACYARCSPFPDTKPVCQHQSILLHHHTVRKLGSMDHFKRHFSTFTRLASEVNNRVRAKGRKLTSKPRSSESMDVRLKVTLNRIASTILAGSFFFLLHSSGQVQSSNVERNTHQNILKQYTNAIQHKNKGTILHVTKYQSQCNIFFPSPCKSCHVTLSLKLKIGIGVPKPYCKTNHTSEVDNSRLWKQNLRKSTYWHCMDR